MATSFNRIPSLVTCNFASHNSFIHLTDWNMEQYTWCILLLKRENNKYLEFYVHICRVRYLQGCAPPTQRSCLWVAGSSRSPFVCHWIIHALLWIFCVASVNKNKATTLDCVPAGHYIPLSGAETMSACYPVLASPHKCDLVPFMTFLSF